MRKEADRMVERKGTSWGSVNAEDLFTIAVRFANFDSFELMKEIHRIQRDKSRNVNERTVSQAMKNLKDRFDKEEGGSK